MDEPTALNLEHSLRSRVRETRSASLRVLVDLGGVEDYAIGARSILQRTFAHLDEKAARIVYVATEPGARALAMWLSRLATPGKSRVTADSDEATRWLTPERSGIHALHDDDVKNAAS